MIMLINLNEKTTKLVLQNNAAIINTKELLGTINYIKATLTPEQYAELVNNYNFDLHEIEYLL